MRARTGGSPQRYTHQGSVRGRTQIKVNLFRVFGTWHERGQWPRHWPPGHGLEARPLELVILFRGEPGRSRPPRGLGLRLRRNAAAKHTAWEARHHPDRRWPPAWRSLVIPHCACSSPPRPLFRIRVQGRPGAPFSVGFCRTWSSQTCRFVVVVPTSGKPCTWSRHSRAASGSRRSRCIPPLASLGWTAPPPGPCSASRSAPGRRPPAPSAAAAVDGNFVAVDGCKSWRAVVRGVSGNGQCAQHCRAVNARPLPPACGW